MILNFIVCVCVCNEWVFHHANFMRHGASAIRHDDRVNVKVGLCIFAIYIFYTTFIYHFSRFFFYTRFVYDDDDFFLSNVCVYKFLYYMNVFLWLWVAIFLYTRWYTFVINDQWTCNELCGRRAYTNNFYFQGMVLLKHTTTSAVVKRCFVYAFINFFLVGLGMMENDLI